MFRASLRSVASDPSRGHHVCRSCLIRPLGRPVRFSQFYSTSSSQAIPASESVQNYSVEQNGPSKPGSNPPDNNGSSTVKARHQPRKVAPTKARRSAARLAKRTRENGSKEEVSGTPKTLEEKITNVLGRKTSTVPKKDSANKITGRIDSTDLSLAPMDVETTPVPGLAYGLDRVLFNPGVYQLRDPRSRVFNFDPYLASIMPVNEFDFATLKPYITSSKDDTLQSITKKERKKYFGSTSSMTSVLSHFHYLLSAWRPVDTRTVSQGFPDKLRSFTQLLRTPSAMFLRYHDGVYSIDADKEFDHANILMNLGKSMEKQLTVPKEEFERYRRTSENKITPEEEQTIPESYHYSTLGDFVMRSQLDAHDPRLPGTGMFDLKTRAVVSIRMDAVNFERGLGYEIKGRYGNFESYEREYFDMIRAAFLKYSLQARMGRMDGCFVAFHNVERIFGFQYISISEMDQALHGQSDTSLGDAEFKLSLSLWNKILDRATAEFPQQHLRFHFEARDTVTPSMYVFVESVTEDEIHSIQTKNQEKIEAYQRRILNLEETDESGSDSDIQSEVSASADSEPWTADDAVDSNDKKDQPISDVAHGTNDGAGNSNIKTHASDAVQDSREPPDDEFLSKLDEDMKGDNKGNGKLLGLSVVVKNKVNGVIVERPTSMTASDKWTIDYEITPFSGPHVQSLYEACQRRREKLLLSRGESDEEAAGNAYLRSLWKLAKEGRQYREEQDAMDKQQGIIALNDETK